MQIIRNGSEKYQERKRNRYHRLHLVKKFKCKNCGCVFRADATYNEWVLFRVTFKGLSVLKTRCPCCKQVVEKIIYHIIQAYFDGVMEESDLKDD